MMGGALVLGFDPRRRSWVTDAAAADEPFALLPHLDGVLHTDGLAAFSTDFGRIVSRTPRAVLSPGSVNDIAKIVRFASEHQLKVAANGQSGTDDMRESHSNFGQAQVQAGVVIDMKPLSTIHSIDCDSADVDAGVHWTALFDAAEAQGLTPPVLTDYVHLSTGGTLSVGGLSGTSQHFGVQADNVLALEVVTGRGDIERCSPRQNPDLFNAVLAGAGPCGIVVRARVRLVPAKTQARVFLLFYDDLQLYLQDQLMLLGDGRFSYLEGQVIRRADDTGWRVMIEAATYFTPPHTPDDGALLVGLRDNRAEAQISTESYRDFTFRLDPTVAFLKSIGVWQLPHPWLSLLLPASRTNAFISQAIAQLTLANTGQGPILLYPFLPAKMHRPLFRVPNEAAAFHLSVLRTGSPDPAVVSAMLAQNRAFYDEAVAVGGNRYIIGAIPDFSPRDWRRHFDGSWGFLVQSKRRFDPENVLTPGQGIFVDH